MVAEKLLSKPWWDLCVQIPICDRKWNLCVRMQMHACTNTICVWSNDQHVLIKIWKCNILNCKCPSPFKTTTCATHNFSTLKTKSTKPLPFCWKKMFENLLKMQNDIYLRQNFNGLPKTTLPIAAAAWSFIPCISHAFPCDQLWCSKTCSCCCSSLLQRD